MVAAAHTAQRDHREPFTDSLWIVFAILADCLPGCSAAIYVGEREEGDLILQKYSVGDKTFAPVIPAEEVAQLSSLLDGRGGTCTWTAAECEPLQLIAEGPLHRDAVILTHALTSDQHPVGFLVVVLGKDQDKSKQAEQSVEYAAHIIQHNLTLESQLDMTSAENAFLSDLVHGAGSLDLSSNAEALITTLVRLAKGVLTFDRLTISIQTSEVKDRLWIEWVEGQHDDYAAEFDYAPAGVLHGEVFKQMKALNIGFMAESEFKGRFKAGDFKKTALTSFLGVPIMQAGSSRGTIALESTARDHFSDRDLGILKAIVQVYGTALCWAQQYHEVHAMATVDGLTQLLNHRSFMERLGEELERASRYGTTMTFLMLDLDHFKQVNDTYGHLHGDYVLWQTAQLVRACIRKADIAGRYGGEEFGVVIINANKRESLTTAERIRKAIADFQYQSNGIKSRISISIGMSEYPVDGHDVNSLIQRADEAMYMVKRRGGNNILSYSPEMENKGNGGE